VILTTTDGRELSRYKAWAKGTQQNPITDAELREKFYRLATTRVSQRQAEQIDAWVSSTESQTEVKSLVQLLTVAD
jgi:2-methylcitrate dehydratase PrpD